MPLSATCTQPFPYCWRNIGVLIQSCPHMPQPWTDHGNLPPGCPPNLSQILHFSSLHFTSLHFTSLHFTSPHFTSPHFTSFDFFSSHFTSLHLSTFASWSAMCNCIIFQKTANVHTKMYTSTTPFSVELFHLTYNWFLGPLLGPIFSSCERQATDCRAPLPPTSARSVSALVMLGGCPSRGKR